VERFVQPVLALVVESESELAALAVE